MTRRTRTDRFIDWMADHHPTVLFLYSVTVGVAVGWPATWLDTALARSREARARALEAYGAQLDRAARLRSDALAPAGPPYDDRFLVDEIQTFKYGGEVRGRQFGKTRDMGRRAGPPRRVLAYAETYTNMLPEPVEARFPADGHLWIEARATLHSGAVLTLFVNGAYATATHVPPFGPSGPSLVARSVQWIRGEPGTSATVAMDIEGGWEASPVCPARLEIALGPPEWEDWS